MAVVGLMSLVTPIGFMIGFVYPVIFTPDSSVSVNSLKRSIFNSIVLEVILTGLFFVLLVIGFYERPLEEIEDQNTE